ncbi:DUF6894 family protein [Methylobacterium sp. Leaf113]|uniref:DUF6894 family protein n=1 Tax=Methylobacterium sp. Leaf113 TaxID=1736259 RepID=UPI000B17C177|nr:hypothetical protein [Methylobacterium sp. Leaf113]
MAVPRQSQSPYRFHCTDGHMAIIDPTGLAIADRTQVRFHAVEVALHAMERVGAALDWSDWIVDVHDGQGRRVLVLPFREILPIREILPVREILPAGEVRPVGKAARVSRAA